MIRQLWVSREGNVLVITGLMILVLVAFAGASVDLGREQMIRLKLQQSADAAALAAALLPAGATNADKKTVAERYFAINYPDVYLGVARPQPIVTIGNTIEVQARADVNMNFVSNVGISQLTANARSVVANGTTTATNYDVLLVMDTSNSMATADVGSGATRDVPAAQLTNVHNNAVATCQGFYAQLAAVLIGITPVDYCNNARDDAGYRQPELHFGLTGATRLNALRSAAYTLATQLLNAGGSNRVGAISWGSEVIDTLPFSTDLASVTGFIDRMYALTGTNSTAALQEALNMASSYDARNVHALVLITDGQNTQSAALRYDPTSGTRMSDNRSPPCDGINLCQRTNDESLPLCDRLKRQGVLVYTIAFGTDVTTGPQATAAQDFLRSCASLNSAGNPNFYIAPDATALSQVLAQVATAIGKVRIAE